MTNRTTLGVKLDQSVRDRLKQAGQLIDRTPHWIIKQAIFLYLAELESGKRPEQINALLPDDWSPIDADIEIHSAPFLTFAQSIQPQSVLRAGITAAYRRPEEEILPTLIEQARFTAAENNSIWQLSSKLVEKLRDGSKQGGRAGLVQDLLQEFSLSSQEGVALMCLAEALLRIPDKATRDALIRDKIGGGDWKSHLGSGGSIFVNAATWGLMLTGKLVATHSERSLSATLNKIIARSGAPIIRKGVDMAMRIMGEQFVSGESIAQALANAQELEAKGFQYSYDMLGEAALTAADAEKYMNDYIQAIHAIGKASNGRGIYAGPGISIKLSAIHPRYSRAQHDRVMKELYPRVLELLLLAKKYNIGLNIDAEEADRLEISLDLLEKLCFETELAGWNGIGFVIQSYQKRCPLVIDYLVDLARRSQHRLMIRLVKGAYWDSEIKRAQLDGLEGYPVYSRKVYTDVSYIACAKKLLAEPDAIYPQFASHNARTLASIYQLAGQTHSQGQYEFQCLHGMGEPLYQQVVGEKTAERIGVPCRVYAPVGTHETLLAYLVRRLLENGANTSFVNRIADKEVALQELLMDPIEIIEQAAASEGELGLPHPKIPLPLNLYGSKRPNSAGIDLSNEHRLASLSAALLSSSSQPWQGLPILQQAVAAGELQPILNPANKTDIVGYSRDATLDEVQQALDIAAHNAPIWQATATQARANLLEIAANLMENRMQELIGLLVREAGKTFNNAIAEVREAVDFLRFYALQCKEQLTNHDHRPLGAVLCISPWNFPLAIFTGQVAAALAGGNSVIAKPAEQTPLIAAEAVRILLEAGIPSGVVQLVPGLGETVGAALVKDQRIKGVMFTGSTEVAKILAKNVAGRLDAKGQPIPLIAETGGQNAMFVDSSALSEQVVIDVISSAFDSAGQRCSALRLLCVQEDCADRVIQMLKGAMQEYRLGSPENYAVDIGPVIDAAAKQNIEQHIEKMRANGRPVHQLYRADLFDAQAGTFVLPTLIELDSVSELEHEVFGPVLHLIRYNRANLDQLITDINATGYGLTMGIHTRIDESIANLVEKSAAGNLYVNRNMVGAVVGVQPFGGEGLSGTGPKAGGPLYLYRLLSSQPTHALQTAVKAMNPLQFEQESAELSKVNQTNCLGELATWAQNNAMPTLAQECQDLAANPLVGMNIELAGPTGESNIYRLLSRERTLCLAQNSADLLTQLATVLVVGSKAIWLNKPDNLQLFAKLPKAVQANIHLVNDWRDASVEFDAILHHGDSDDLIALSKEVAARPGTIISITTRPIGASHIAIDRLIIERALSINTAAAGGNASLMTID